MNILIIGSGGREHALAWKLKQSPKVQEIFIAPGNAGTTSLGKNSALDTSNHQAVIDFSKQNDIGLIVVGPDDVLASGMVNSVQKAGIKIFGPTKEAAEIEWSKAYSKNLMKKLEIPTAQSEAFQDFESAKKYIESHPYPLVIKASGLALGKGVVIAKSAEEAIAALQEMMIEKIFGISGETIIIEEFLQGYEVSIHAFSDGAHVSMFPVAQDHKQIFDGDKGPNTGGMGTVAPFPSISAAMVKEIEQKVVMPVIQELKNSGREFKGILFPGIMMTKNGLKVLEFNARFGDPETQSFMRILKTDLVDILLACIDGNLDGVKIKWEENLSACCVVLASPGYPGAYPKELPIAGIENAEKIKDMIVFHAGTKNLADTLVTNGGRVMGVSAIGSSLPEALKKAYRAVDVINFEGKQFRTDIG